MFFRLLVESFRRQKRRKALAAAAILLGTTAVTAMLALATTIGDRIHQELAVYGANIVVTPKAANLSVRVGGLEVQPATGGAYLHVADLEKLRTIFWHNNITGVSPERTMGLSGQLLGPNGLPQGPAFSVAGKFLWFNHRFGTLTTGASALHPWWKLEGRWPASESKPAFREGGTEVVLGRAFAEAHGLHLNDRFLLGAQGSRDAPEALVVGLVSTGDDTEKGVLLNLDALENVGSIGPGGVAQHAGVGELTRIDISAKTRPEDAFARKDPDTLPAKQRDLWYCRPYANSIAYQIREAIPAADAQQVRQVEQSEGTVLSRISGLMWLVSAAALLAAGFAVSAAMATAVLERRGEIGLMRSLGAGRGAIAALFYAESGILALVAGAAGYVAGSGLAWALGRHIFPADRAVPIFNLVLLPVIGGLAVAVSVAGSTPAIRSGLRDEVSGVLRGNG